MQKQNPIDDLFRRGLADYRVTSSGERREEFMKDVGEPGKRPWPLWWLIGGIGLILVGTGLWMLMGSDRVKDEPISGKISTGVKVTNDQVTGERLIADAKTKVNDEPAASPSSQNNSYHGLLASRVKPAGNVLRAANVQPTNKAAVVKMNEPENGDVEKSKAVTGASTDEVAKSEAVTATIAASDLKAKKQAAIPVTAAVAPTAETKDQQVRPETQNEEKEPVYKVKSNLPKKWNISAGVYYTPEWMFNTLNGDKYVNNMGVEGTFHFGKYSVRTGAGLSITTGWHEVQVQSNPYLGSYKELDSIVFIWDTKQYKLVPTYYTSGTNVYDTARQYNYSYIKKQYTYLQVPLVLGYDFWQNSWITLGFRAGAVMSLLLNTETLSQTYDPGMDRIVSINNVTPDRIQMNWQGMGGINAAFRLSRRFSIELEPDVRYYFNSVYESSEITKKPWSIGVRAAFLITF